MSPTCPTNLLQYTLQSNINNNKNQEGTRINTNAILVISLTHQKAPLSFNIQNVKKINKLLQGNVTKFC